MIRSLFLQRSSPPQVSGVTTLAIVACDRVKKRRMEPARASGATIKASRPSVARRVSFVLLRLCARLYLRAHGLTALSRFHPHPSLGKV